MITNSTTEKTIKQSNKTRQAPAQDAKRVKTKRWDRAAKRKDWIQA